MMRDLLDLAFVAGTLGLGAVFLWSAIDAHLHPERWT